MNSRGLSFVMGALLVSVAAGVGCGSSASGGAGSGGASGGSNAGAGKGGAGSGGSHTGTGGTHSSGGESAGADAAGADSGGASGAAGAPENAGAGGLVGQGGSSGGGAGVGGKGSGGAPAGGAPGGPTRIDLASGFDGISPQIGVDDAGNATAVWLQNQSGSYSIWSNRYSNTGSTWGTTTRLDATAAPSGSPPQIAVSAGGSAIVVWGQPGSVGAPVSTWARRFTGSAWATAKLIETDDAGPIVAPVVGIDAKGNAVAVWNQSAAGGTYTLRSSSYDAKTDTWSSPIQVETGHVGNGSRFHVAVGSTGDAVVVWTQNATGTINVWASRLVAGSNVWTAAAALQNAAADSGEDAAVSINAGNVAVAVWSETDSKSTKTWSARSTGTATWSTAVKLQSTDLSSFVGDVALDSAGNAVTAWLQDSVSIWTNRYSAAATSWVGDTALVGANTDAHLAGNAAGQVAGVWLSGGLVRGGTLDLSASGSKWSAPINVQTDAIAPSERPRVALNGKGGAFAVWQRTETARSRIWANRFP